MNIIWEVNFTTISVLVMWTATVIGGILYLMRQGDVRNNLTKAIEDSMKDRKSIHQEQAVLEAKISLINENMIGNYIKREELSSYRTEQQNFLNSFEEKMSRSVDRLGDRLDRVLHDLVKGAD